MKENLPTIKTGGSIPLSTLCLRLAQANGMRINGKYEYSAKIEGNQLLWSLEKLDIAGRKINE